MIYDGMLLFGVLFVVSIPLTFISLETRELFWVEPIIQAYYLLACFSYLAWFWSHGGQTLGMRAWRLRLVTPTGVSPSIGSLAIRFLASLLSWLLLGAGYVLILFDANREALHDKLSRTYILHDIANQAQND